MPPRKRKAAAAAGSKKKKGGKAAEAAEAGGEEAQTKKSKTSALQHEGVVESGHMFVLFRPKVGLEAAHSLKEVQRVFLWLSPERVKLADGKAHPLHHEESEAKKPEEAPAAAAQPSEKAAEEPAAAAAQPTTTAQATDEKSAAAGGGDGGGGESTSAGQAPPAAAMETEEKEEPKQHKITPRKQHIGSKMHKLIILPSKVLPNHSHRQPHFAFVDEAAKDIAAIQARLGHISYHTKSSGVHTVEGAVAVAECVYEIVQKGNVTYLAYELITPQPIDEAQKTFGLEQKGIFLVSVKNPHRSDAGGTTSTGAAVPDIKQHPHFPKELMEEFHGKRVAELKFTHLHPQMLEFKGTQLLLIGCKETPGQILGPEIIADLDKACEAEATSTDAEAVKKIHQETGLPTEPVMHSLAAEK